MNLSMETKMTAISMEREKDQETERGKGRTGSVLVGAVEVIDYQLPPGHRGLAVQPREAPPAKPAHLLKNIQRLGVCVCVCVCMRVCVGVGG